MIRMSDEEKRGVYESLVKTVVIVNPYVPEEEEEELTGLDATMEEEEEEPKRDFKKERKGVGVMIGNGLVLTSSKLVSGVANLTYQFIHDNNSIDAQVLHIDYPRDLVILKSKTIKENAIVKLENDVSTISYGDTVFTFMHPEDCNFSFGIGNIGSPRILLNAIYVGLGDSNFDYSDSPDVPMILVENFHTNHESKGAPVFNTRGNLIGIVSTTEKAYDYAVHIEAIRDFIDKKIINVDPKAKGKEKIDG